MSIFRSPEGLPQKIARFVVGEYADDFIAAFKTNIKPNETIPLLWMIVYRGGFLFCNTHKTRGLYRDIKISSVDSVKITSSEYVPPVIQVIFKDINENDFYVESPAGTSEQELNDIFEKLKIQIL